MAIRLMADFAANLMKTAVTTQGEPIQADPTAPKRAFCPNCGGPVSLRQRRSMDGHVSYFWRHDDNRRLHCLQRLSPTRPRA